MDDRLLLALLAGSLALGLVGLGAVLQRGITRWLRRGRLLRRWQGARQAEVAAEGLLHRAGYRILERQPVVRWTVLLDGQPRAVTLRPDLLVAGRSGRYVVEVKSGLQAPNALSRATLRQLLAYRAALAVDGVLLLDMEAGRLQEVRFPAPPEAAAGPAPGWSSDRKSVV